ncbi:MAG: tol-pal system protein YbgF [Pseudomonadales bacterium]|nr:tol-pal system protein YbgF [Pseudomonadales bacterium]
MRLFAGALLSSLVFCAQAQSTGPLAVEDRSLSRTSSTSSSAGSSPVNQDGLLLLMQQQEQFEEQLQHLQGQIEELRHEIRVMKDAERERYLDLDTRINTLAEQGKTEQPDPSADAGENDPQADRKAYSAAKDQLIKRDFDAAAEAFEGYLNDFPNGQFRAHAHFWLGKVYSNQKTPQNDKAMAQFQSVVDDYPDHSKAPASLYTLAVMQARAGKVSEAKINLHKLIKQYPDSSEAGQAKTLLDQLDQ